MTPKLGAITLRKGQDRLFTYTDQLVILVAGLAIGALWASKKLGRLDLEDTVSIISDAFPLLLTLPLGGVLEAAFENKPTDALTLKIEPLPNIGLSRQADAVGFNHILWHPISPIFVNFFEAHKLWIEQKFGSLKNWPPTFYFVRTIRNAVAHGGKINWTHSSQEAVWHHFRFSQLDHGKQIIEVGGVFSPADLFFLMIDASDELDTLGCPLK